VTLTAAPCHVPDHGAFVKYEKNGRPGERFPLFLLFFQEIISEDMVFAAEILARGSSTLGKTAESPAVLTLFPLHS